MKRPLMLVALLYVLGLLLATLPMPLVPLFALSLFFILLFVVWPKARYLSLAALIVLAGCINHTAHTAILSPHDLRKLIVRDETIASVRGILKNSPTRRTHNSHDHDYWTTLAQLEIHEIQLDQTNWQPAFVKILITTRGNLPEEFFAQQKVQIDGVLKPPPAALAAGLFDYRNYLSQQGIYYELAVSHTNDWRLLTSPASRPLADRFSAWARKTLARGLPHEDQTLRLEWALTLGWKAVLTEEVSEPFVRAATLVDFPNPIMDFGRSIR